MPPVETETVAVGREADAHTEHITALHLFGLGQKPAPPPPPQSIFGLGLLSKMAPKTLFMGGLVAVSLTLILVGTVFGGGGSARTTAIVKTDSDMKLLHKYVCSNCEYHIMPAIGREKKFYKPELGCPECGAPKEAFFDANDLSDPRSVEYAEKLRKETELMERIKAEIDGEDVEEEVEEEEEVFVLEDGRELTKEEFEAMQASAEVDVVDTETKTEEKGKYVLEDGREVTKEEYEALLASGQIKEGGGKGDGEGEPQGEINEPQSS